LEAYEKRVAPLAEHDIAVFNARKSTFDFLPPAPPKDWSVQVSQVATLNQGLPSETATCTAFATAALITDIRLLKNGAKSNVSPSHLHMCLEGKGIKQAIDPFDMLENIVSKPLGYWFQGEAYPYPLNACQHQAPNFQMSGSYYNGVTGTKTALLNGPVLAVIKVPDSFWNFRGSAPFSDTSPGKSLHSVEVVGWSGNQWRIRNSQGPAWGDGKGFATILQGCCEIGPHGPNLGSHSIFF